MQKSWDHTVMDNITTLNPSQIAVVTAAISMYWYTNISTFRNWMRLLYKSWWTTKRFLRVQEAERMMNILQWRTGEIPEIWFWAKICFKLPNINNNLCNVATFKTNHYTRSKKQKRQPTETILLWTSFSMSFPNQMLTVHIL